jgi:exodeoxyribonuclease V alpha subunit
MNTFNNNPHNAFACFFKEEHLASYAYALSKKMEEGHICIETDNLPQDDEFWQYFTGKRASGENLKGSQFVSNTTIGEVKPFVLQNDKLYLQRYFHYEFEIINKLVDLTKLEEKQLKDRKDFIQNQKEFIKTLWSIDENVSDFSVEERPDWQLIAVIQGFINNLTIITGGPGTGKTTTVAKILALLNQSNSNLKVALAAPTGKAAVRMKESLLLSARKNQKLGITELTNSLETKTIHRLLGPIHNSPFFKSNKENPLDYDVIIIDESSMIGVAMFAKLLNAISVNTRLILLGDSEQLASVDLGSLFGDLCKALAENENKFSKEPLSFLNKLLNAERLLSDDYLLKTSNSDLNEHLIRLKKTYRYDQNSKMGRFTKAVIMGLDNDLEEIEKLEDKSLLIDTNYSDSVFNNFIKKYIHFIEEKEIVKALEKLNDCRVLCAVKQSDQGVYKVNEKIVSYLKQKCKEFNPNDDFYENQPIMITKNLPDLNLFNGDIGLVRKSEWHGNKLMVFFPLGNDTEYGKVNEKLKAVNPGFISDWETVFAMTIHKCQGSEFKDVLVILPKNEKNRLLTRELLYTAVTRAKKEGEAIVQGSMETIKSATRQKVERISGIAERIQKNRL